MTHQCHYPHVPECRHLTTGAFIFKTDDYPDRDPHDDSLCGYCESLRACEQRSYALGIEVGKHDGWLAGHAAGVQAARDAVADRRVPWPTATGDLVNEGIDDALAAIDALTKEDK